MIGEDMLSSVETKEGAASKRSVGREEVTLRQSRWRDRGHHCPGMRSKQGLDEREEGDAVWQPSGV